MTATDDVSGIAVSLGPCDDMRAEVFVRLLASGASVARVTGTLVGPRRGRDTTLPTTSRLVPLPGGAADAGAVSRAILTEPAYWTPELPNRYRVEVAAEDADGTTVGHADTLIGLRRLGVRGRSLWLDGRRWVPRVLVAGGRPDLDAVKAASLGSVLTGGWDEDLARADEMGVALVPLLGADDLTTARIAGLAQHPAAMLALVATDVPTDEVSGRLAAVRRVKGTMLIGRAVDGNQPPPAATPFDFLAVRLAAGHVPHEAWRAGSAVPLIAWRQDGAEPMSGRSACDGLQRDLAGWGLAAGDGRLLWDWAGYLVGAAPRSP
ncbi:MAG: hypothetical protein K8S94_16550 [Planctomycetia bacterium]|nr:hypothetical protein [Planctomycetia bacterium]